MLKRIIGAFLGFVVLAMVSLGANDYLTQSVIARTHPAEFGVQGWVDSFAERGRMAAERAKKELRRDKPMRDYLPPAPAGWARVDWHPDYDQAVRGRRPAPGLDAQLVMAEIEKTTVVKLMEAVESFTGITKSRNSSKSRYVYTNGDKVVILNARFVDPQNEGRAMGFASLINGPSLEFEEHPIRHVHRGIAFRDMSTGNAATGADLLKARIGADLEITVRAYKADAELPQILSRLNVAALRSLATPLQGDARQPGHIELTAELRRQQQQARHAAMDERETVDRMLAQKARSAGKDVQEVCVEYRRKTYCRWVD